jgi:NADPH:quinone reductase-like Zn-dependent oxidoreductase
VGVADGPFGDRGGQAAGFDAQRGEGVLDPDGDGRIEGAGDQAVTLQGAQRLGQHLLGDAVEEPAELVEAQRAVEATERTEDVQRPLVRQYVDDRPRRTVAAVRLHPVPESGIHEVPRYQTSAFFTTDTAGVEDGDMTMRAITQYTFGDPDVLELAQLDRPEPGPGEVLVRVRAAGVNPSDWKIRSGLLPRFGPPPFVLGLDFAGTREDTGEEVYGVVYPPRGAYAEFTVASLDRLARKPSTSDWAPTAALPTAALTAYQPLAGIAKIKPGDRVLIHAAAGGVGHLAVQIAKSRGAYVIGTARAAKHDFLRGLGADELIDYTTTDFTTAVRDVDVVLDPIGAEYAVRSLDVLTPDGILVDVRGTGPDRTEVRAKAATLGIRYEEFRMAPATNDLEAIARLVDDGVLRVSVAQVFPLEHAAKAHELSQSGRVAGKVVLTVRGEARRPRGW